ncbi:MAG: nicotinamide mononucleotide transporter [Gammaproteobacteria bacterium]|nr:nicotinamide mononucleotide transporter [Gammaproteobacteria bacterium]
MDLTEFSAGFFGASSIEIVASISGFICVYLIIIRSLWCWPIGLLQVVLYMFVFYEVRLYSDLLLHGIYVFLQIYGWWYWALNKRVRDDIEIIGIQPQQLMGWSLVVLLGTVALGWGMSSFTEASLPYPDAFTTAASLVAQWLLSRRQLMSWVFWISVDVVAIWIYWQKALVPTTVLYVVFLIMATTGLVVWLKRLEIQRAISEPAEV